MLRLVGIRKQFGTQRVLDGIDLELDDGETLVLIGRSGGGKSVLLKHIVGLLKPDAGEVWFNDRDLVTCSETELTPIRRQIGMVFQNGALFDSMNVGENVAFGLREQQHHLGLTEREIRQRVAEMLERVDLPNQQKKMPADLSGGMRKRVALARAVITKPRLVLYDEPTAGLDPIAADSIDKLILRLSHAEKIGSLVITHDMKSACNIANRIAMLHLGRIHCVMNPEDLMKSQDPIVHRFTHGISESEEDASSNKEAV